MTYHDRLQSMAIKRGLDPTDQKVISAMNDIARARMQSTSSSREDDDDGLGMILGGAALAGIGFLGGALTGDLF